MNLDVTIVVVLSSYTKRAAEALLSLSSIRCKQIIIADTTEDGACKAVIPESMAIPRVDYIHMRKATKGMACNAANKFALGKYITYLDAGDEVSEVAVQNVMDLFDRSYDQINCVAVKVQYLRAPEKRTQLGFRFNKTDIISIAERPNFIQKTLKGVFFITDAVKAYCFDEELSCIDDISLITDMITSKGSYGIVSGHIYWSDEEIPGNMEDRQIPLSWFYEILNMAANKLCGTGVTSEYGQYLLFFILSEVILNSDVDNSVLSEAEIGQLWSYIKKLVKAIPDDKLLQTSSINRQYLNLLFQIKYGGVYSGDRKEVGVTQRIASIATFELTEDALHITGYLCTNDIDVGITVIRNDGNFIADIKPYKKFDKYILGVKALSAYSFECIIPLEEDCDNKISLFYICGDVKQQLAVKHTYKSPLSFFSNMYCFSMSWIARMLDTKTIYIQPFTKNVLMEAEINLETEIGTKYPAEANEVISIRQQYLREYESLRKRRIWLFTDSPDRADDNAEYLFKYALYQKDGIEKYFVVSKDSVDYERLCSYGNVVAHGEREHLLLLFSCERLISSHLQYSISECGLFKFYRGFMTTRQSFIQHGIMMNGLYDVFDQLWINFNFFLTSSEKEKEFILHNGHGMNEQILRLTGMPRFDSLSLDSGREGQSKKILVAFTWHKNIVGHRLPDGTRDYNPSFCESDYFKGINSFINNEDLRNEALALGYEILLKLHPYVAQQSMDFNVSSPVKIVTGDVSYQRLFAECCLLVTDYSSVSFDFSYLRKPVVYYQFEPNHYPGGYFDYESMGFGEVTDNVRDAVGLVIKYMRTGCMVSEKYLERINEFYQYSDTDNCKRVYQELTGMNTR